MKIRSNIAILMAGSLAVTTSLFAKDGLDNESIQSSSTNSSSTSSRSGRAGDTSNTAGTSGTAGDVSKITDTSGLAGSSDTTSTAGTLGDIDLEKKVIASIGDRLMVIPCIDVRDSESDGYYNVVMKLADDGNILDWKLKRAEKTTDPICNYVFDNEIDTDGVLAAIGMPSVSELTGTVGAAGTTGVIIDPDLRKKVIVSFSNYLLVIPCVDVQAPVFHGIYDVVMEGNPDNIENWKVKKALIRSEQSCDGDFAGRIIIDDVLQTINMPTAAELNNNP